MASSSPASDSPAQLVKRWALAAVSACLAETVTFPLDFTKTRLQLQNELGRSLTGEVAVGRGAGMLSTAVSIAQKEGIAAM
jgi:solute carrier family 25 (mitochondrial uncoupling protein), member 27